MFLNLGSMVILVGCSLGPSLSCTLFFCFVIFSFTSHPNGNKRTQRTTTLEKGSVLSSLLRDCSSNGHSRLLSDHHGCCSDKGVIMSHPPFLSLRSFLGVADKDPADILDRKRCLDYLAALRHAKWFQVNGSLAFNGRATHI